MPRKRDGPAADLSRRVNAAFGRRLAAARSRADLLQQDLGERLGLSRTSISNIECGARAVFLDQLYRAAHALGVEPSELLPPMAEVLPATAVHTAPDDSVSEEHALNVLRRVEAKLERPLSQQRQRR